jgi:hypothetical protein
MGGHIVMQALAPAQFHDREYIKDAEAGCEHHERVTSHDGLGLIVHKGQPSLTRIRRPATRWPAKYFRNVLGGHADSQLPFQLAERVFLSPWTSSVRTSGTLDDAIGSAYPVSPLPARRAQST